MTTRPGQDPTAAERVAGELTAALAREAAAGEALPPALAARIVAAGEREVGARAAVVPIASRRRPAVLPWLLAAAAVVAWLVVPSPLLRRAPERGGAGSVVALRDSVLADPALVRVAWGPSTDPAGQGAAGEVLWSPALQRGVLRFEGLAPNDPRLAQYQLWIVDAGRDARYPVDGGVFDVTAAGEVLVPVAARLPVARPTLFAVTLEKPGGVVVSTRERLVLAAAVGG